MSEQRKYRSWTAKQKLEMPEDTASTIAFVVRAATFVLCIALLLALLSGCGGPGKPAAKPSQMIAAGSWYPYEQWPHDGHPYASEHFVVYSDSASTDARKEVAAIAEDALGRVLSELDVQSTDLRFPAGRRKIDIYAYHDYYPRDWGGRAYYGGLIIWSLDHEHRDLDRTNYTRVLTHELTHVVSYLILGGDGPGVDMWFSEGLAELVSGGTAGEEISGLERLHEMTAKYDRGNPIAIHEEPSGGFCTGKKTDREDCKDPVAFFEYYYPMFHLAVGYLSDEDGLGRSLADVSGILFDMRDGTSFAAAFERRMGISLADYEGHFFELMESYLKRGPD